MCQDLNMQSVSLLYWYHLLQIASVTDTANASTETSVKSVSTKQAVSLNSFSIFVVLCFLLGKEQI